MQKYDPPEAVHLEAIVVVQPELSLSLQVPQVPELQYGTEERELQSASIEHPWHMYPGPSVTHFGAVNDEHPALSLIRHKPQVPPLQ